MSLTLQNQLRLYELLASKRMTETARAVAQQRFVNAWGDGAVRVLIRELEGLPDMSADEVEDRWQEIEDSYDEVLKAFAKENESDE